MFKIVVLCDCCRIFFFQAEDGIRDLVRSRGLGDVYKRQDYVKIDGSFIRSLEKERTNREIVTAIVAVAHSLGCLLYTSDAADERSSVDLGGRRIIKQKNKDMTYTTTNQYITITQETIITMAITQTSIKKQ